MANGYVADMPHLGEHGLRAAADHLAEGDAVGELGAQRALPLRHGIRALIARLPRAFGDGLVLVDEAGPRPDRDRAVLVIAAEPAKRPRLGPGAVDQMQRLGEALARFCDSAGLML